MDRLPDTSVQWFPNLLLLCTARGWASCQLSTESLMIAQELYKIKLARMVTLRRARLKRPPWTSDSTLVNSPQTVYSLGTTALMGGRVNFQIWKRILLQSYAHYPGSKLHWIQWNLLLSNCIGNWHSTGQIPLNLVLVLKAPFTTSRKGNSCNT